MKKIVIILLIIVVAAVLFVSIRRNRNVAVAPATSNVTEEKKAADNQPKQETSKSMGLEIKTTKEGTGERTVKNGDNIAVHYTGKLTDGTKFDSSLDRGTPFEFMIGQGMVIQGWEQGLLGMKVGEKRTLTIPSDLGYGSRGAAGVIPPNATLIFDVELISIK